MRWGRYLIVYLLLGAAAGFIYQKQDLAVPVNKPLTSIPLKHGDWTTISQAQFDERTLAVLKPSDYLSRTYADSAGNRVDLYLGYHGGGPETGEIHSPKHCLPGSGWHRVSEEVETLPLDNGEVSLVRAAYQKGDAKELFLYWFHVRGKTLTNEYALKFTEIMNSMLYNRQDATFVRISVSFDEDKDKAFAVGERFVRDFFAEIDAVLPK